MWLVAIGGLSASAGRRWSGCLRLSRRWAAAQAGRGICVTVSKSEPRVGGYNAAGGCGGQGAGESSTGTNGTVLYEVVPTTTRTISILTGPHSRRQVRPEDGVIIAYTRFRYG